MTKEAQTPTASSTNTDKDFLPKRNKPFTDAVQLTSALAEIKDRPDLLGLPEVDPAAIEVGLALRRARVGAGLSQPDLSRLTGVPQSAISDIERGIGKNGPSFRMIKTLASALKHELKLLPEEGEPALVDPVAVSEDNWIKVLQGEQEIIHIDTFYNSEACLRLARSVLSEKDIRTREVGGHEWLLSEHQLRKIRYDLSCKVWTMKPHAHSRFKSLSPMMVVTISGRAAFIFSNRPKSTAAKTITGKRRVIVVNKGQPLAVINEGAKDLTLLTVPLSRAVKDVVGK
jgi:transcriptional regulator with XRE-family HTH domain